MSYRQIFWVRSKWASVCRWYHRRSEWAQFNLFIWATGIALVVFAMWGRKMW